MRSSHDSATRWPSHGQIGFLQIPAPDLAASAAFYAAVFGWSVDPDSGSFTAPE